MGGALVLFVACVLSGCMGDEARDEGDAGGPATNLDAGTSPAADGGAVVRDAGPSPMSDAGGRGEYGWDGPDRAHESCFNGADDNGDGTSDCDDLSCRANVPACCVGVSAATCCTRSDTVELPIDTCLGETGACEDLIALAEPFGSPPTVEQEHDHRVLVLRGQTADSGLLVRAPIDLRDEAVTLTAHIATSGAPHELATDFVGVGLVDADEPDELVRVAPRVSLLVSGNRNEVGLLLAGELVMRWPVVDSAFHEYGLSIRPDGRVELTYDGSVVGSATLPLERPLRPVIYGRSFNPGPDDPPPARIRSLSIAPEACDVPAAVTTTRAPVLPASGATGWENVRHAGAPSVARFVNASGEAEERMAVEIDGAIHLARRGDEGWELIAPLDTPALAPAEWAERVGDPALRWTGHTLELFFTGFPSDGRGRIARVEAAEGVEHFSWADVEVLLEPELPVTSYADPAPFTHAGTDYLALREDESATSRLVLYRLDTLARLQVLREPGADLFAFDRDEVASPSVLVTGDVLRMYFAGRRGARFGIGVLVSPDAVHWTEPTGGALVLDASGAGFDALGVRDPAPIIDGDELHLFYTGLDGAQARVGFALGSAPPAR